MVLDGPYTEEFGLEATRSLLERDEAPTAIITASTKRLVGCLRYFRQRGLRPGEDVSLVGCDDVDVTELADPPISAITRDGVQGGRIAAELLLRRLAGEETPPTVVLPTKYVARASSAPPAKAVVGAR
jgi:LacI family transcriptional regulator